MADLDERPQWLTVCDVPEGIAKRFYYFPHAWAALKCLEAGYEDNAASWIWRDDGDAKPVAGTLKLDVTPYGMIAISYVDARDVSEAMRCLGGDGI